MRRPILAVLAFVSVLAAQYPPSTNARSLQGRRISTTAPNNIEVLAYLSATGQWTPTGLGAGGLDLVAGASTLTTVSVIPRVSSAGVLGPSKLYDWGSTNPVQVVGTTFEVVDRATLGSESLNETDFATHANWDVTGDMDDTGGNATYTHNTGVGTLKQVAAKLAVALVANRHYVFTYTVSGKSGDPACTIDTTAAAATQYGTETRTLTLTAGAQTTYFKSAAAVTDFGLSCTSTSGGVTLDDVSLKEVQGGDVVVSGLITGGGTGGIRVTSGNNVGIGTTGPGSKLEVAASDGNLMTLGGVAGGAGKQRFLAFQDGTNVQWRVNIQSDNATRDIGANPSYALALDSRDGGTGFTIYRWPAIAGIAKELLRLNDATFQITDMSGNMRLYVHQSSGNVGIGTASPDRLLHAEHDLATSGGTGYVQRLTRTCAGAGGCAAGDGAGLQFELETATGGTNKVAAGIDVRWTTATAGSEDGRIEFYTTKAGVETLGMTLDKNAGLTLVGLLDAASYKVGGVAGYNGAISVRKGDDSGACTITVTNGIVTATTC